MGGLQVFVLGLVILLLVCVGVCTCVPAVILVYAGLVSGDMKALIVGVLCGGAFLGICWTASRIDRKINESRKGNGPGQIKKT